ncbi:MAG: DUF3147 family protein [Sulfurovaceae bacterium]|nr:DUF3147 family protein [Sulfurovaceae bacterium]
MIYYLTKIIITTILIVIISEISKRNTLIGSILASIPLVSVLAMIWLYVDTNNSTKVIELSNSIMVLIIPSLTLFIALPILIKKGFSFYPSLLISIILTIFAYYLIILISEKLGIKL